MSIDQTDASAIEANKRTAAQFMEAFSSGDVDRTMAMMSDDATWWVAGTMCLSGTYDKAAFAALLGGVVDNCKGPIMLTPKAFTAEGDRVAIETESYVETNAGKVYNNHYHFLFVVRDGQICEVKEYLDTMHTNDVFCS